MAQRSSRRCNRRRCRNQHGIGPTRSTDPLVLRSDFAISSRTRLGTGTAVAAAGRVLLADVPATALSSRAAYEVTSRFDTGLLTFTLTRSEAEAYLVAHPAEGKWLASSSAQADVTPHDFAHFGLPEPETFKDGMRYGYVCPDATKDTKATKATKATKDPGASAVYDTSDERCVRLCAYEYSPKRTRIYLRAHFEPGISPLPATPSASASAG